MSWPIRLRSRQRQQYTALDPFFRVRAAGCWFWGSVHEFLFLRPYLRRWRTPPGRSLRLPGNRDLYLQPPSYEEGIGSAMKKQYRRRRAESESDSGEEREEGEMEEPRKKQRQDSADERRSSRDRHRNGSSRRRDRECCFNIEKSHHVWRDR